MQQLKLKNPLWTYAIQRYQQGKTAEILLHLQDKYHLNVNLLLALGWISQQEIALDTEHITILSSAIKVMDESLVQPTRTLRRKIREMPQIDSSIYDKIKTVELNLEQHILATLYAETSGLKTNETTRKKDFLQHNIRLYTESVPNIDSDNDDIRQLLSVLSQSAAKQ